MGIYPVGGYTNRGPRAIAVDDRSERRAERSLPVISDPVPASTVLPVGFESRVAAQAEMRFVARHCCGICPDYARRAVRGVYRNARLLEVVYRRTPRLAEGGMDVCGLSLG